MAGKSRVANGQVEESEWIEKKKINSAWLLSHEHSFRLAIYNANHDPVKLIIYKKKSTVL